MQNHFTKEIIKRIEQANIEEQGIALHLEIFKDTDGFYNVYIEGKGNKFKQEECGLLENDIDFALFINNLLEANL